MRAMAYIANGTLTSRATMMANGPVMVAAAVMEVAAMAEVPAGQAAEKTPEKKPEAEKDSRHLAGVLEAYPQLTPDEAREMIKELGG